MLSTLPETVRPTVSEAIEAVRNGDEARAREVLAEAFGSACDAERPAHHEVSETGRVSLCHRHLEEYEEPEPVFERRLGGVPGESGGRGGDAGTPADVDD
jgi:peptide/nickel transport system ATP-binding protein